MATKETDRFSELTERQKAYLRHVFQHRNSQQIAGIEGVSARAVDKQLLLAKDKIGATSRFEAARMFAAFEAGVEPSYPAENPPSPTPVWPLPLPVPTAARPTNTMNWRQVLLWGVIIAIAVPLLLSSGLIAIDALLRLLGARH